MTYAAGLIRNLEGIAQYLQPFIDSINNKIESAERFYQALFNYRNALSAGHVLARGESVMLDPSEVVYFVRMMEPIIERGKIVRYDINPAQSLIAQLGFDDAFLVDDYMAQFGERDRAAHAAAREAARVEAELRALIAQQDREHAEAAEKDRVKFLQHSAATTIQRVARGSKARKNVQSMVELDKHISALRNAIADRTAGVIAADAEVLSGLSETEKKIYARLRNAHLFDKQKK